jgi:hypothetical protein
VKCERPAREALARAVLHASTLAHDGPNGKFRQVPFSRHNPTAQVRMIVLRFIVLALTP